MLWSGKASDFALVPPIILCFAVSSINANDKDGQKRKRVALIGTRNTRKPRRVAIVDDEPLIGELVSEILLSQGDRVEVYTSPRIALKFLVTEEYDLIFCDMRMPELHGTEFYKIVKSINPEAAPRFIFLTGDSTGSLIERFLREERCPCVAKPFTRKQIESAIARIEKERYFSLPKAA